jgi:uncharacterized protein
VPSAGEWLRVFTYVCTMTTVGDFVWNREKAADNLEDHGVSFVSAAVAWDDPWALQMPDHKHEDRTVSVGMDDIGRVLFVVSTWEGEKVRIIHAREASTVLRKRYEESRKP